MNLSHFEHALDRLTHRQQLRSLIPVQPQGQFIKLTDNSKPLINISSNDYLAIGADTQLQEEFLEHMYNLPKSERPSFGSTSSRLLTGNYQHLEDLETQLENFYQHNKTALVVNSGYHANIGILPAIAVLPSQTGDTLILADKLVHASLIDGIRLATLNSRCTYTRYRHNNYQHLRQLITQNQIASRIIIVTESVFSMDGDVANLAELVTIKETDNRIELYVDEAHAVGVMGKCGLGLAEQTNTINDIDYLVGTFGKAFASMGAFIMCHSVVKQWLINSMRPLIYSTALPPITHTWNNFILQKMPHFQDKRAYLQQLSHEIRQTIETISEEKNPSRSPIIPYILGSNDKAINTAKKLQQMGFYALPIRPPTVAENSARIRLVMNAGIDDMMCERLVKVLIEV